jgi:hypothetical protein
MTVPNEFALANIARVDIVTEETTPVTYTLTDVATEADVVAFTSAGQEQELRVKNVIKAQNNTEDIVKGYDISLTQATFIPEILALVDGGTWDEVTEKYSAPVVGTPVARTPFTMDIYTEQKDGDGGTTGYVKFSYKNCKGRPVNYSVVDGGFFSPQMQIRSRSKFGESPVEVAMLEALPV